MKRSNDYQSHDAFKKPRVAQGYNNFAAHGGMAGNANGADMYGAYGANMMGSYNSMPNGNGPQYGSQYGGGVGLGGGDHGGIPPYQGGYPAPAFGTPYANVPFQMSFPPNGAMGPAGPGLTNGIRTLYIGNLPQGTTIEEVLNLIRTGLVENARMLPDKNCAFVSFMEPASAAAFHQEALTRKPNLNGQEVRVGWGKASTPPANVVQAVAQGATRNVFLGSVDESITEHSLHEDCSKFGVVDSIKILREKNIAFIHFASIMSAMKAVAGLPNEMAYSGRRVHYGKDRCAKTGGPGATAGGAVGGAFTFGGPSYPQYGSSMPVSFNPTFDRFAGRQNGGGAAPGGAGSSHAVGNVNTSTVPAEALFADRNRTVYLGSIAPDTTCEDMCNVIRGGILSNIRYFPQKHMAFVTFVDPSAAETFVEQASRLGFMVKNRRLKVGWGQNSHQLPVPVIQAIQAGATRNVYLGGLNAMISEEKLRQDFQEFGEIELVNLLKEKNCGFVNFTNILSAVKAIDGIRRHPDYLSVKVNYGKDRCGNAPKMNRPNLNANNNNNNNNNNGQQNNNDGTAKTEHSEESADLGDDEMFDLQ
ncbi:hypothetical protein BGZ83_009388 [Gryganskiella cystojenkinii]|nr:hypothetical protein BGZ83_009388 [Gryganskiella cystojenkinii]